MVYSAGFLNQSGAIRRPNPKDSLGVGEGRDDTIPAREYSAENLTNLRCSQLRVGAKCDRIADSRDS